MSSREGKCSIIAYWIGAIILLATIIGTGLFQRCTRESEKAGAEVLLMGDSILAQSSVGELLVARGTYEVVNCAIGGTTLSPCQDSTGTELREMKNVLCMAALTHSICNGDFGAQRATRATEDVLKYLPATVGTLSDISFEKTNVLVFNHGINDFYAAVEPDDLENPLNVDTFGGALRQVFADLQKNYPRLRIIYVTPPYVWYGNDGDAGQGEEPGKASLENYVNLALDICREYRVEAVDIYHNMYDLTRADAETFYTLDGLHPSEEGSALIAEKIAEAIGAE